MPPAAQVKMDRKAILVDELTGISVLAPNSPTLYTHRGIPAHDLFFGWVQGLETGSCLPQRVSRNCWLRPSFLPAGTRLAFFLAYPRLAPWANLLRPCAALQTV